jgi:hypothetical protein
MILDLRPIWLLNMSRYFVFINYLLCLIISSELTFATKSFIEYLSFKVDPYKLFNNGLKFLRVCKQIML